jgi:hypothetical protein
MLDGRQVAVIASATAAEADRALELLMDTTPGDRWENAVTSCLTVLCRRDAGQSIDRDLATATTNEAALPRCCTRARWGAGRSQQN